MERKSKDLNLKPYSELVIDAAEDVCKGGYNVGLFALNVFYRVSNINALKESFDAYQIEKLSQVIEDFQYEHSKINDENKRKFYEDLKYNKQNLEFLFSLFDKSRKSTYRIHMQLLAYLSSSLVDNKELNYHQKTLLANIDILNDEDLIHFYRVLKNSGIDINEAEIKKISILFPVKTYTEHYIFNKLESVGLIVTFSSSGGFNFAPPSEDILKDKSFYIHNFTVEIYNFLDLIFREEYKF